ncbi:Thiol-disulfide isomerase or thioredoxin [Chitinophaga sp. CF118]|uniref:TlpA family protein disulfide reductase n=1 Tax=Chitinophaga sp. CF118 TaxID=1884367 RepID=UPI0008F3531A|nr:TlpA disulfide reductase family protein [Chitinophaga sp. CF118]SFE41575.1 Thiol-disulfide isomerase or thioredoxin [Chitinophaga sp. CF118]
MILRRTMCLITALCSVSLAKAQIEKNLVITPNAPEVGKQITLAYHPDSTMLATGKPVKAVAYYYDTLYRWSVADIKLDENYKVTIQLPPAAGFVAFKFKAGNVTDNNRDSGYMRMITHPGRQQAAANNAGYAFLRAPRLHLGIPDYFQSYNISDSAVFFWIGNEIARFRGASRALAITYISTAGRLEQIGATGLADATRMNRAASYMLHQPDLKDKERFQLADVYERYLHQPARADSIRTLLPAKQPAYLTASKEKDPDKRVLLWKQFLKDFPASYELDEAMGIDYSKIYRDLFSVSIARQDTAILRSYIKDCPFIVLAFVYYKMVEIPYADWKTMPAKTAYTFSQPIMDRFQQLKAAQPVEYWYYSPDEWREYCDKMFVNDYITHARILKETGRNKEALELASYAQQLLQYTRAELNEVQAELLQQADKKKELSEVLRNSVRLNQASATIFDLLKKEYNNDNGFDAYLASLKDAHTMELLKEDVKASMISTPAAPFVLSDLNGKEVSLEKLKGKVVVLDFWATWCAPCKAGMPGMKMAQEHFKKDSNVVFLFVDTQERAPDYKEKVKTFITDKKYPFQVLFDKGEDTYAAYAKLIKTSGIPFKVVIDGKGEIRFAEVGYKGSPSGLADEISMMIELAK